MLRHTVLCLVLAFQCTTAIEWEELADRIEDHHDEQGLPEYRDDWFWDDHFWRYPHMMRMECPDGYGWTGDYKNGECEMCMSGQYSASWGPTVRCTKCPPRTYQPNAGSSECIRCPEWSPISDVGSKSASDCKKLHDDKMLQTYSAKVVAEIEVSGDYTFLNDMLNELSGYPAHEMSAHIMYDKTKDVSKGSVSLSMARRAAFEAYMYVQEIKYMIPLVNDWISTGHAYVNRIFSMLNVADTFYLLDLDMDPSEIHQKLKNVKVLKIDSEYHENCEATQEPYELKSGMHFCKFDNIFTTSEASQRYLSYTGKSHACKTLGGINRLRKYISQEWETLNCGKKEHCAKSLMTCEYDQAKEESWIVVYVSKKYATKLDDTFFKDIKLMDDKDVEFTLNKQFSVTDCPGGPKESTTDTCQTKCDENHVVSWANGRCSGCPFGSFMDKGKKECENCDWLSSNGNRFYDYFISETYMPYSVGKESCIAYHGDHTVISDPTANTKFYRIDKRPFDIPRDNRQRYEMNLEGKLSVCYAIQLKEDFGEFCSDAYNDIKSLSFDDFTDFDLTKLSCLVRDRISELYKSNCEDREYSWPPTENFYWLNAACMAVRHVMKTEESMKEKSIGCDDVDESLRFLTMPFHLHKGFSNDLDWGSILIPLLHPVDSMMKADFSTVTSAVKGALDHIGLYKTTQLTGLKMTEYVRDLILGIPANLKMSKGSWKMLNEKDDVFCDDGKVKKDCRSACALPYNQCLQKSGDNFELTCTADECNDCAVKYTYKDTKDQEQVYSCVGVCKNLLTITDGFVSLVTANPEKKGEKLHHLACNKGFRVKAEDAYYKSCKDEKPKKYSCDEGGTPTESFECVVDKCAYPTEKLENGFIKSYNAHPERSCRYAEMACKAGFELKGDAVRFCDKEGNWLGDMPKCEPFKCSDKETSIENGMLINELVGNKMSWYRCNVNNPSYKGENDYFAADKCGEEIVCGRHKNDHCPPTIENGYKVREWKHMSKEKKDREKEIWNAQYDCKPNFMIQNHELFKDDDEKNGWSQCSESEGNKLPSCIAIDDGSGGGVKKPCKMPKFTQNGKLIKEFKNDKGLVTHGQYVCNPGFEMVKTIKGDMGFCRDWDHSYELPYCETPEKWYRMEFELVGGYSKMEHAGRVKARHVDKDGNTGDWYVACDDHFNSPAAGSICRALGYKHGKMIDAPKKMRPIENVPFGITNFWCYYDDVLPRSKSCHGEDYGKVGYPLCMPDEQITVACFDVWWNVDVKFQLKSTKRKHKMFCPVEVEKEGIKMKTKKMGLHVKWGGLKKNAKGEYDYTEFTEGTHYESKKYRKKKGFRVNYLGDINSYDCFYCNVHLGKHWMNPMDGKPRHNHNCGQ